MPTLCTIGFQKKPLSEFIDLLRQANVDAVIDIRLRNTSQLAGYTKRDDLAFLLTQGFGIAYEHRLELAPSDALLDDYRQDKDWTRFEARFVPLLIERRAEAVGKELFSRYQTICLLCSEPTADQCHRRLVAEHWAEHFADLDILHL
jgi:uncharacterized protein (DUF488 family)